MGSTYHIEGFGQNEGLFAHVEAKPPASTPSALRYLDTSEGIGLYRQGGEAHIGFALESHVAMGCGPQKLRRPGNSSM